jgi:hypothetical protein
MTTTSFSLFDCDRSITLVFVIIFCVGLNVEEGKASVLNNTFEGNLLSGIEVDKR